MLSPICFALLAAAAALALDGPGPPGGRRDANPRRPARTIHAVALLAPLTAGPLVILASPSAGWRCLDGDRLALGNMLRIRRRACVARTRQPARQGAAVALVLMAPSLVPASRPAAPPTTTRRVIRRRPCGAGRASKGGPAPESTWLTVDQLSAELTSPDPRLRLAGEEACAECHNCPTVTFASAGPTVNAGSPSRRRRLMTTSRTTCASGKPRSTKAPRSPPAKSVEDRRCAPVERAVPKLAPAEASAARCDPPGTERRSASTPAARSPRAGETTASTGTTTASRTWT